jgi:translation elongation factor EF-Tu-like GTPase
MKLEPFQMSISEIRKTDQGIFIEGIVEQGVLHEGDSIRFGRNITTVKFMKAKSASKDNDPITMVYIHYFSDDYVPADKHRITHRDSVRFYIPTLNIPSNFFQGIEKIHYVNRNYAYMPIEDVFEAKGRGICFTGSLWYGQLTIGDRIRLTNDTVPDIETEIASFETFGHVERIEAGDNIGVMLKDMTLDDVKGKFIATTEGLSEASE